MKRVAKDDVILEGERDGFQYRVFKEQDDNPDLSFIGTYTDKPKLFPYWDRATEQTITSQEERDAADAEMDEAGYRSPYNTREYRFIESGSGNAEYMEKDVERLADYEKFEWCMLVVIAEVYKGGVKLGSSCIGGVESDSTEQDFQMFAKEQLEDAMAEAKDRLPKLIAQLTAD